MSVSMQVAGARLALGRQLASLRENAGLTQAHAGYRIGYSRSAVARAKATGVCSRDYCRLVGRLYGAADDLAVGHDRVEALAVAARSHAARRARQRRHPAPQVPAPPGQNEVTVTATAGACPHCRRPVAVLLRQSAALLALDDQDGAGDPVLRRGVTPS